QNSPHSIIYEYKSPQTGCSNRDTAIVEVIDADASITGIRTSAKYCNFDAPFLITGSNILGTTGTFAITGGVGLTDNQNNTATLNPSLLSAGNYSISYSYFDGVQLTIFKDIVIEIMEEARIFGLSDTRYCRNIAPIEITGNYSGGEFTGNSVFKNLQTNRFYFNPALVNPGTTSLEYTYTTSYGCLISKSVNKIVSSVPNVDFKVNNGCYSEDSTSFKNLTVFSDPVVNWTWRFGDLQASELDNRSSLFEPKHKYPSIGNRTVRLIAENIYGCKDTLDKSIHLGDVPKADFYPESECYQTGVPISFKNTSTSIDQLVKFTWDIEDTSKLNFNYSTKDILHTFPVLKNFRAKLYVSTDYNCSDSITKVVSLRPVYTLKDTMYRQDMELGNDYWFNSDTLAGNNWYYGTPDGNKIKAAFSGSNAFYTSLKEPRKNQQLIITSPCFDFTGTSRPYISMETFSDATEGQEGTVLQSSTDEGLTWQNVGAINSGTNWYNDYNIQSQPGNQLVGWSGLNTSWRSSRHNLDSLQNKTRVRFRLIFGQTNKTTQTDGFAFDNITIGSRSKYVLLEHFTNNSQAKSLESNAILDEVVALQENDAISVQYHTSFPGVDTFNMHNPSDPGARVLYYGIGVTPYTLLDGGNEPKHTFTYKDAENNPDINKVKQQSLKEAFLPSILK
ncbi:MAG: hypothetical protein HC830_10590, partial [Bacteroidetes bacterium]|nr:hypothetical protein [Bacteroidota bacterium]